MAAVKRFCRYYGLETENSEERSNLERELKKRLLQEKYIRRIQNASVEDIADAMEGNGNTGLILYDSGEFDVLYSKNWIIKKPGLFRNPGLYGIEFVVKAMPQDLVDLQKYLERSKISVKEARKVTKAITNLATIPLPKTSIKNFSRLIENLARTDFPKITGEFSFENECIWRNERSGYTSTGIYSGPVEDILRFRNTVIRMGESNGTAITEDSVSFQ